MTLHSLLDRDVYRGGAIVVGPGAARPRPPAAGGAARGAGHGRRGAARAGLRARAVAHGRGAPHLGPAAGVGDAGGRPGGVEQLAPRQGDAPLRLHRRAARACSSSPACAATATRSCACARCGEVGNLRDPEAFDDAVEIVGGWSRDERREGVKVLLQALTEKQIGRRDQAARWLWHLAEYSREVHEEYAVQRWPETKRLLGLLVNSAGAAHARNARRLVQAARKQDRRLSAALLAAALAHTPEAQQVLDGARMRMARKPSALARELLRNFPKGKRRRGGGRRRSRRAAATPTGRQGPAPDAGRTRPAEPDARRRRTGDDGGADRAASRGAGRPSERRRQASADAVLGRRAVSAAGAPRRRRAPPGPSPVSTSSAPAVVDAGGGALAAVPATVSPRSASRARHAARTSSAGAPSQRRAARAARPAPPRRRARRRRAPARWRCPRSSSGNSVVEHVEADAQHRPALLRAALHEDARELAAVEPDVVGPLDPRIAPGSASQTATAAASGSSLGSSSRSTSDISRALPGGAVQARPWRPRPAVCSSAVTSVPCGAPARGQLLGALVGRVGQRGGARAGAPIIAAAAAPRRRAGARAWRRRRRG